MSQHHAVISWKRATSDFKYETYDRSHLIRFGGGVEIQASAAPEFKGRPELVNPEEQFVASLSSCHMLTFLALAARNRLVVESYEDEAVGYLEKKEAGRFWIARVILKPRVKFSSDGTPSPEKIHELHEKAHQECFIANSVSTQVEIASR